MNFEAPNNKEDINQAKKDKLDKIRTEIEELTDGLGLKMDEGIKDTVLYLKALGFNTSGSCEGHVEREGQKWNHIPYVSFEAPNMPEYRFEKQEEIYERIASENNISVDDMGRDEKYQDLSDKAWAELSSLHGKNEWPLTEEARAWVEENKKLYEDLSSLLDDFYKNRETKEEDRLVLTGNYNTMIRVTNNAGVYTNIDKDGFRYKSRDAEVEGDLEEIAEKVQTWQLEMQDFTEFLKDKFLTT